MAEAGPLTLPEEAVRQAAQRIAAAQHLVVFTGAGISVECGIPPFRGPGGLWTRVDPRLAERSHFLAHPAEVWDFWRERFFSGVVAEARPGKAHEIIARWEADGLVKAVVTQNVDSLHRKAGSREVLELHGSCRDVRCEGCGAILPAGRVDLRPRIPRCPECREGMLRPDVVMFEEQLPQRVWAAAEAMSNLVAVGGNPREASLIDNFIWPFPDPPSLGDLDRAVDACVDIMNALGRPFISGKDSLSSTYRYPDGRVLKIPPVLCISVFGRIDDVRRTVTSDFKSPGSTLVLVGARDVEGLGGSAWLDVQGLRGNRAPRVDLEILPRTLDAVYAAIRTGRILACHDVAEGGLFAAVAEMGFGGDLGAEVDVAGLAPRPDVALFNETAGVFVVEVADAATAEALFENVPHVVFGRTVPEAELRVRDGDRVLFAAPLPELQAAWERPMRAVFH